MKFSNYIAPLLFIALLSFTFCSSDNNSTEEQSQNVEDFTPSSISDSLSVVSYKQFKNLEIFLLRSKAGIQSKEYVTLTEALEKKYVSVNETGDVNELAISNNSPHYIFIHSGDIVKGGKQDRTLSMDVIIGPHSKNIPLKSFCVESGRWRKRGEESMGEFSSNKAILSSRKLKYAAKAKSSQQGVWDEVANQQGKLNQNISRITNKNVSVYDSVSASSLQLTLENTDLDSIRYNYKQEFISLISENPEATGYAYAINGELYGIELYNNKKLFYDLWEKLLNASIVESVSEMSEDSVFKTVSVDQIVALMKRGEESKVTEQNVNSETLLKIADEKIKMEFNTIDVELNKWVHKNYISVDSTMTKPQIDLQQRNINSMPDMRNIDIQQIQQIRD